MKSESITMNNTNIKAFELSQDHITTGKDEPFLNAVFEPELAQALPQDGLETALTEAVSAPEYDGNTLSGNEYAANGLNPVAIDLPQDAGVEATEIQAAEAAGSSAYPWLAGLGLGGGLIAGLASSGGGSGSESHGKNAEAKPKAAAVIQNKPVENRMEKVAGQDEEAVEHQIDDKVSDSVPVEEPISLPGEEESKQEAAASVQTTERVGPETQAQPVVQPRQPLVQPVPAEEEPQVTASLNHNEKEALESDEPQSEEEPSSRPNVTEEQAAEQSSVPEVTNEIPQNNEKVAVEPSTVGSVEIAESEAEGLAGPAAKAQNEENPNTLAEISKKQEIDLTTTGPKTVTTSAFISSNVPSGASYTVVKNAAEAAKAAAGNSGLKHIVISDGDHHTLFTKGAGGDYTAKWGSGTWGATFKDSVSVAAFHNGGGDITSALQSAINIAAKKGLGVEMPTDGTFVLSGKGAVVLAGTDYLSGNNSTLVYKDITSGFKSGITLAKNVKDVEIEGFNFDLQNLEGVRGIAGINSSGVTIENNNFVNVKNRAISFVTQDGNIDDLTIKNNNIVLKEGVKSDANSNYAIVLYNQSESSLYSGSLTKWHEYRGDKKVADNKYQITDALITGNKITGGYYGISFSGVSNSTISNNVISENMRNISMQNRSDNNKVINNYLTEGKSSAVHIAYMSNNNTVSKNIVSSSKASGQGLLQAYQGSQNNKFTHNEVNVTSKLGTGWMLYTGTDSNGTVFGHNTLNGNVNRKVVGVESIWDSNSSNGVVGAYMPRPLTLHDIVTKQNYTTSYNGGTGDLNDVRVTDNIIASNATNKQVSVLFMGAETSSGLYGNENLVGDINNLKFTGNHVMGGGFYKFVDTHTNGADINGFINQHNGDMKGTVQNYVGSAANNAYFIDNVHDTVKESANGGKDTVYSTVDYTLSDNVENLVLLNIRPINGTGNDLDNLIKGNVGANVLDGGLGNDVLIGGEGRDVLTGGEGNDTFLFNAQLNGEVDRVTDFTADSDKLGLSTLVFGALEGDWFAQANAVTRETRVIQNGNKLFYDADGSGKYFSAVQFAELDGVDYELSASNFTIY